VLGCKTKPHNCFLSSLLGWSTFVRRTVNGTPFGFLFRVARFFR